MKTTRTILSILLATLILVSSTSFTVGMHLCRGEVQDVALFSKAEACEMEQKLPPCHRHTTAPCCEDEAMMHEADDLKVSSQIQIAPVGYMDIEQLPRLISEIIPVDPSSRTHYPDYSPPLRSCDLTVALGVFLI